MTTKDKKITLRASSAARFALCPASYHRSLGLPDEQTVDAARGSSIHQYIAHKLMSLPLPTLPDDDLVTAENLMGRADSILSSRGGSYRWHTVEGELEGLGWTGHPDAIAVCADGSFSIVDFKTGWGDVPDADSNLQLRIYACLLLLSLDKDGPIPPIYAHIIAKPGSTSTLYDEDAINAAMAEMVLIRKNVVAAEKAKANPGPSQCQYCRACGNPERCTESCATGEAIVTLTGSQAVMSPITLSKILDFGKVYDICIKKARDYAKEVISTGTEIPGWHLEEGSRIKKITDAAVAYQRTDGLLTEAMAFAACTMSVPGLIEQRTARIIQLQEKAGGKITKKDAKSQATEEVLAALGDVVEERQNAPSLKRSE